MERRAVNVTNLAPTPAEAPSSPEPSYASSLYTEINIPLPALPGTPIAAAPASPTSPESKARRRGSSLSSFAPFQRKSPSSPPPLGPLQQQSPPRERRIELSMSAVSRSRKKRSGTVGAAIVPAVMVLRAELFTPGQGDREKKIDEIKDRLEVVPER